MAVSQLADVALYYEVVGEGPPLLFIHGLGSRTHDWVYQVVLFGGYYRTITFDLRGHGQSSKPPGPYSIPQLAADAAGLLAVNLKSVVSQAVELPDSVVNRAAQVFD